MNPEPAQPAPEEQFKPIKINFKLNNAIILPLEVTPNDNFHEIKQFLSESSELYLYSSFHLEANGNPINEFDEIKNMELQNEQSIDVVIDPYDEKNAKAHVKKVQELITNTHLIPTILGNLTNNQQTLFGKTAENKEEAKDKNKTSQDQPTNQEEKNGNLKQYIQTNLSTYAAVASAKEKKVAAQKIACVISLNFSGFNPPPSNRKLLGDFFYLNLKTLECNDYHITSAPYGFILNSSTYRQFDPRPQPNSPYFVTLFDLFKAVSPLFKTNFEKLLKSNPSWDALDLPKLSLFKYGTKWLTLPSELNEQIHEWNLNRNENFLLNLHGLDPNTNREWNEELQICRDLPRVDFFNRLNRDKSLIKSHADFVEAAVEGAKAIVNKLISPLNPSDQKIQQVFVYNNLFFSFAIDTPDSFKQETGPEAAPTLSSTNADLRNLKLLHRLDIPGLHLLNTAIIDYKGYRVLAQSIIPGILNTDHNICTIYGSIDEGKTIYKNEEFHEIMKKICEHFFLEEEVKFLDEKEQEVTLAGSIEVKGLMGSDRKKYVLDLMRLNPRDLNYVGETPEQKEQFLCCVLRTELITNYVITKNLESASQAINKEYEELAKNANTEEKKKQSLEKLVKLQEYFYNQKIEKNGKYKFNSNLETKVRLAPSEKLEGQRKDLEELAQFIVKQAIPNLITDLVNGESIRLTDSNSISEIFHSHGINMRYLGKVIKQIDFKEHPHLKILVERVLLVKCLKHICRGIMREAGPVFIIKSLAHLLNCLFACNKVKKIMDEGKVPVPEPVVKEKKEKEQGATSQNVNTDNKEGKNKKKKSKKKGKKQEEQKDSSKEAAGNEEERKIADKIEFITPALKIDAPNVLGLKPSQVWQRVNEIASKRYGYKFEENYEEFEGFKYGFNKLATLRDFCLTVGLQITCKDYDLEGSTGKLPFLESDLIEISPLVKHLDVASDDVQANMEIAQKFFLEGKFKEALEAFQNSIQLLLNLYGPLHKDVGLCYAKIANIYYKTGELEQAILYQKQSLHTLKKLYGLDHYYTVQSISNLGLFYFSIKYYDKAFKYMLKSLYLVNLIGGESHPDSFLTFMNLSLMYQESQQHQAALNCLYEALNRNIEIFGPNHVKVGITYQAIALSHFEIDDLKRAIEYQEKCAKILSESLKPDDMRIKEANAHLAKFKKTLEEKQKSQAVKNMNTGDGKRGFGQNKATGKKEEKIGDAMNPEGFHYKDREYLLQKSKMAKMNAKFGFRKNNNTMDWNRFLLSQQGALYENMENMPQSPSEIEKILAEKIAEEGLDKGKDKENK